MTNHRDEALRALETVEKILTAPTLDPLQKQMALGALEYAKNEVVAIQEIKRPRKAAAEEGTAS